MGRRKPTGHKKRITPSVKTVVLAQHLQTTAHIPASTWRRLGGFLIDYLLLGIPNSIVVWLLKDSGLYTPIALYYNIFLTAIILFYFIFFTYKNNGQTFGKMIVGTKVVGWKKDLTLSKIVLRYGFLFFLFQFIALYKLVTGASLGIGFVVLNVLVLLLVFILLMIDDEHRGVHDLVAGTWVVRSAK